MPKLGDAWVNIRANLKPLRKGLSRAANIVKNAMRKIGRIARRLALIAVAGITAVSIAVIKLATDAVESENLYRISMGKFVDVTRKWSEELSAALGLNTFQVRKMTGILNVMFKSMGVAADSAKEMAEKLTLLTFDLASFFNLRVEDAFAKIQGGMVGMVRPLRVLGILVNENVIEAFARSTGILKKSQKQMTQVQKVFARFGAIMKATTAAQGDMARTLEDAANVFRVIKARVVLLGIDIGNQLLPKVTEVARQFRDWLKNSKPQILAFTQIFVNKMKSAFETVTEVAQKFWDTVMGNDTNAVRIDSRQAEKALKRLTLDARRPKEIKFSTEELKNRLDNITKAFTDLAERIANVFTDTILENADKIGLAIWKGFLFGAVKLPFAVGKVIGEKGLEVFDKAIQQPEPPVSIRGRVAFETVDGKRMVVLLDKIANNTRTEGLR